MKILIISPESPEISVGGVERDMKNLIDYCLRKNKEAVFLLPTNGKETTERNGNVLILRKNFLYLNYKTVFNKKEVPERELREKSKSFFVFLLNMLEEEKIDLVDSQNFYTGFPPIYSLVLNMACFSKNIPLVLRCHSFTKTEMQKSIVNDLLWEKIVCVSKSVAGDMFNKGSSINKLSTHYLGVNITEFKPQAESPWLKNNLRLGEKTKIVLHASRIISGRKDILKEKGITTLLEAFSQLALKNQDLMLVIAMAKPPEKLTQEFSQAKDKLSGYIKLNNLEGRVLLKEFELEEMPLVYNGANIFVLASENETFGQVYIEAMACGTPVIGANVGGIPEIITDNYDGFLIPPNNSILLAQKIEGLIYDEKTRKEFIKNGLKTIRRKFSIDRQLGILFNYFEKIVAGRLILFKASLSAFS
ncbi:MAG: glycosyltransferase family 4 protein [Candidatus Staskawiczbacteria bacterium]|nr:glycosyltransferase family 4 protein [Candidatus Staskawiczbacteria bacterium]